MESGFIHFVKEEEKVQDSVEALKKEIVRLNEEISYMEQIHSLEVYALKRQLRNQST